ncbi:MAG TPA: hypothetical protein VN238_00845, partial [Solirubrobacteraceae bacterium]|nr:hypothetical protein [Solirubrobacteraceae bacterium]
MSRTEPFHNGEGRRARASRLAAIVGTCVLLGAVAGLVVALLQDERHEAAATVLLAAPGAGADVVSGSPAEGDAELVHRTSAALLDSDPVRRRAVTRLAAARVADPAARVEDVETDVRGDSSVATVTATAPTHPLAARVADEYARAYLDVRRAAVRSRLSDLATALEERAALLGREGADAAALERTRARATQLRALSAVEPADAQLLQTAAPSGAAQDAPLLAFGLAGAAIGLLAGLLLSLLLRRDTSRVAGEQQAEELL